MVTPTAAHDPRPSHCSQGAKPQPPLFLLRPSYWAPSLFSGRGASSLAQLRASLQAKFRQAAGESTTFSTVASSSSCGGGGGAATPSSGVVAAAGPSMIEIGGKAIDADVFTETEAVCSLAGAEGATVELLDLSRVFSSITVRRGKYRFMLPYLVRRNFQAVKGISLSLRSGQVFALLGHNGAGKTTTFSMIAAQSQPTGGDVCIHGLSARENAPEVRTHLGICPQHDILFPEYA